MPPLHRESKVLKQTTTAEDLDYTNDEGTGDFKDQEASVPISSRSAVAGEEEGNMNSTATHSTMQGAMPSKRDDIQVTPTKNGASKSPTESTPLLDSQEHTYPLEEVLRKIPTTPFRPAVPFTGRAMAGFWFFRIILPSTALAWYFTNSVIVAFLAALFVPCVSIYQGATGMLHYRATFGDSPAPKAPSHGVVKVQTKLPMPSASKRQVPMSSPGRQGSESINDHTPLRLLVIGDSLAMGVGQSLNSTPVMPETIAKTLSRGMGGRPVLWTCHGASGASAGWIVRELERSIQHGMFASATDPEDHEASHSSISFDLAESVDDDEIARASGQAKMAPRDDSSSDDSSSEDQAVDDETHTWQEKLRQERIHFDPNTVGPFDIAVVLTGSNDLKSAFFPYLLTGEDVEFRRQAQERGGGYSSELTRIIETLNHRMRQRLETLRESVEEATQKMRERLGSMDSVLPHSPESRRRPKATNSTPQETKKESNIIRGDISEESDFDTPVSPHFPMVVLPGNPARALPVFTKKPLHWLAIPMVDIMDSHKRGIAIKFPDDVMFVPAPTPPQIAEYKNGAGELRKQELKEDVLLNLRDIKKRHANQLESEMNTYFHLGPHGPTNKTHSNAEWNRHFEVFSVDGTHPNDEGYQFWGRHIGHNILLDWKAREKGTT